LFDKAGVESQRDLGFWHGGKINHHTMINCPSPTPEDLAVRMSELMSVLMPRKQ
jgi:hypothetical protein